MSEFSPKTHQMIDFNVEEYLNEHYEEQPAQNENYNPEVFSYLYHIHIKRFNRERTVLGLDRSNESYLDMIG